MSWSSRSEILCRVSGSSHDPDEDGVDLVKEQGENDDAVLGEVLVDDTLLADPFLIPFMLRYAGKT